MSYQDAPLVLSDVPGGLVVRIITDYGKAVPTVLKGHIDTSHSEGLQGVQRLTTRLEEIFRRSEAIEVRPRELHYSQIQGEEHGSRVVSGTFRSQGSEEGVHVAATLTEQALEQTKHVVGLRGMTGRIEEIFKRSKPIEVAPRELHASPIQREEHETRVVRHRVKEGDCLPEELAHLKPFHVYHNEDGSLELYWLVYNRLRRVG